MASATEVAIRAAEELERLSRRLVRLVGELGISTLVRRSIVLAGDELPWLAPSASISELRASLELRTPALAADGFVAVLTELVELLERMIGESLVERVLRDVWPQAFRPDAGVPT